VSRPSLCIVAEHPVSVSETFIQDHIDSLSAETVFLHGRCPMIGPRPAPPLVGRLFSSRFLPRPDWTATRAYEHAFRRIRPDVVLAEYGPAGVMVLDACRTLGIPLVVHFHGYDASLREVVERYADGYRTMFETADAIVAVSRSMEARLVALGASPTKVRYNPYGVDCDRFRGGDPAAAPPVLVAVGRLVEKKGPLLTIRAFAAVHRTYTDARLRVIGEGPLRHECVRLVRELGLQHAVTLLGAQPHAVVAQEMRRARAFVQHSLEASTGDSEGTPVAVLEAGATGLPVVSTRHGGIPDIVIDGDTGLLVAEGDVEGMATAMARLVTDPARASRLGAAARRHVSTHHARGERLATLWSILASCVRG
jgi:colanic acid/amylovoran biosynthesis glycosyltransferase